MENRSKHDEILLWLRRSRVETGSMVCLGCGHEQNCGVHGCAMLAAAADAMENLRTENAALRCVIEHLRKDLEAQGAAAE